jgi:hypothetical protein
VLCLQGIDSHHNPAGEAKKQEQHDICSCNSVSLVVDNPFLL